MLDPTAGWREGHDSGQMLDSIRKKSTTRKVSKWEREKLSLFSPLSGSQCCPPEGTPVYREDDDTNPDIWNAPTRTLKGDGLHPTSRYRLHERAFFHALGIHNDGVIARRLGMSACALEKLLNRCGIPANFP